MKAVQEECKSATFKTSFKVHLSIGHTVCIAAEYATVGAVSACYYVTDC